MVIKKTEVVVHYIVIIIVPISNQCSVLLDATDTSKNTVTEKTQGINTAY